MGVLSATLSYFLRIQNISISLQQIDLKIMISINVVKLNKKERKNNKLNYKYNNIKDRKAQPKLVTFITTSKIEKLNQSW